MRPTNGTNDDGIDAGIAVLREVIEHARATPRLAERLGRADVAVHIEVTDAQAGYTLVLREDDVALVDGDAGRAQATLRLDTAALRGLLAGDPPLAMQIAAGTVAFTGAVRRLLRVEPILRAEARRLAVVAEERRAA